MWPDMAGRRAFITGASSGLGAHFARLLSKQGVSGLALAARRIELLDDVAAECRALGATDICTLALDIADADAITAAFAEARHRLGGIDLLVNNAGIAATTPALETTPDAFDRVLDVNLRGAWLCAIEAAKGMRGAQDERGSGGDIVNIASILGLRVANSVAPYAISKAAVIQMTKALALELARYDIRVNALAPGYIATDINADFFASDAGKAMVARIPMRRLGELADLDAPFLLLASGSSRYLTGAVLTVDGAHHCNSL